MEISKSEYLFWAYYLSVKCLLACVLVHACTCVCARVRVCAEAFTSAELLKYDGNLKRAI